MSSMNVVLDSETLDWSVWRPRAFWFKRHFHYFGPIHQDKNVLLVLPLLTKPLNNLPIYSVWCGTRWAHLWGYACWPGSPYRSSWFQVLGLASHIRRHTGSHGPPQVPGVPLKGLSTVLSPYAGQSAFPEEKNCKWPYKICYHWVSLWPLSCRVRLYDHYHRHNLVNMDNHSLINCLQYGVMGYK